MFVKRARKVSVEIIEKHSYQPHPEATQHFSLEVNPIYGYYWGL
jgi:hypothetical protein